MPENLSLDGYPTFVSARAGGAGVSLVPVA